MVLKKKGISLSIILILCSISILSCTKNNKTDSFKPNVIFISIDSLRRDHLSCYGYFRETSPNIDKLAAKGTIFENAVSTTCWTLPSHMSMFTGLYNMQHGVDDDNTNALRTGIKTMPEFMRENGYLTYGIFSGPFLHPAFGFSRGFDQYVDCSSSKDLAQNINEIQKLTPYLSKMHFESHEDITGNKIYEAFSKWYSERDRSRPYFAFLHMWDVHYDYKPPPPYDKLYDPHYQGIMSTSFNNNPRLGPHICTRDLEHLIALYDGEINWTDYIIGQILDKLRKSGEIDNTMIVITSDHGEEFLEHGQFGHDNLYDELVRIPLIIYFKGTFPNKRLDYHISHIDLLPTILDIIGNTIPDYIPGLSIKRIIEENNKKERPLLLELTSKARNKLIKSVRAEEWKFLYDIGNSKPSFYDLKSDPDEKHSLIPLQEPVIIPDSVKDKTKISLKFYERINNTLPHFRTEESDKPQLDSATVEHLKALGYIN